MKPGIYDLPAEQYHRHAGSLSSTGARQIVNDCPAAFRWQRDHPINKREFDIGTATHLLVLEPERFERRVVIVRGNTKDGKPSEGYSSADAKEQRDAAYAAGKTPLLPDEYDMVHDMRAALHADPMGAAAFVDGVAEKSLFWQDAEFGITCRTRPDWLPNHSRYIIDLKTAFDGSPEGFGRAAAGAGYGQQAAWYLDGIEAVTGERPARFAFVVIEKRPPYLVSTYWVPDDELERGRIANRYARGVFAYCQATGQWPGYTQKVSEPARAFDLVTPAWHKIAFDNRAMAGGFEPPTLPQSEGIAA